LRKKSKSNLLDHSVFERDTDSADLSINVFGIVVLGSNQDMNRMTKLLKRAIG